MDSNHNRATLRPKKQLIFKKILPLLHRLAEQDFGGATCLAERRVWRSGVLGGAACLAERHAWRSGMLGGAACLAERHAWRSSMFGGAARLTEQKFP